LRKLDDGDVDGVVLAAAGLARLGIERPHLKEFTRDEMVPAPGQGAIAVQAREDDAETRGYLAALDHEDSHDAFAAERRLVRELGAGCGLPLGGYASIRRNPRAFREERLTVPVTDILPRVVDLKALVFDPNPDPADDTPPWASVEVTEEHPHHAGIAAAEALLALGAGRILEKIGGTA
jgi:hydroxymethylbilane synthase